MGETERADGQRSEWAIYVQSAVDFYGGNVSLLAREADVGRSSIYRYLNDAPTRVTIEVASKIARARGDDPANAIRAAGALLDTEDEAQDPRLAGLDPIDPAVRRILDGPWDEGMKDFMLHELRRTRARQTQEELDRIEQQIEIWRRAQEREQAPGPERTD